MLFFISVMPGELIQILGNERDDILKRNENYLDGCLSLFGNDLRLSTIFGGVFGVGDETKCHEVTSG